MSPMTRTDLLRAMRTLDACAEATEWVEATDAEPADLWGRCERGDWMIWLACEADVGARTLREIACDCAERVLHVYEAQHPDDPRPRQAVEVARRFARGEASGEELDAARDAVWDAAEANAWDAAWNAAWDAAWAAEGAARTAAWNAAWAASRSAARTAARAAAGDAERRAQADIVRARLPWSEVEAALQRTVRGAA